MDRFRGKRCFKPRTFSPTLEKKMENSIAATVRSEDARGKGAARKLRASGKIPATLYGAAAPMSVEVDPRALDDIFRVSRNHNTIVQVNVNGQDVPCLVKEAQRHPLSREILHVDLYAVPEDRDIEVRVPVEAVGKSKGAAVGGRVRIIRREVRVVCHYRRIPLTVQVDVSALDIGEQIRVSAVPMPEGLRIAYETDYAVLSIVGKSKRGEK
jgi:large subunit ribosomal protein L25